MQLSCDLMFTNHVITHFIPSVQVKKIFFTWSIFGEDMINTVVGHFFGFTV